MVSPAELVEAISDVTGVSLPTVTDIDRRLVKADLRSRAGRGRHVAMTTTLDAARLLSAILASPQSNKAADAVRRYEATRVDAMRSSNALFREIQLDDLATLIAGHSFVEGLAALLASAASGSLHSLLRSLPDTAPPRIEIYAFTRASRGRIRLSGLPERKTASLEYEPLTKGFDAPAADLGDLEQSRRITERTIYRIAARLREEGRDG